METIANKLYEAMFLVDSVLATANWENVMKSVEKIMERAEAKIVSIAKWDERKLAYEVNKKERGTYILCYFNAPGKSIEIIERQVRLSEEFLRVLILCSDHVTKEEIDEIISCCSSAKEQQDSLPEEIEEPQKIDAEEKPQEDSPETEDSKSYDASEETEIKEQS